MVPLIKIENARGEVLDLSADPRYEPMLQNTGPVSATVNRTKRRGAPGSRYNSSSQNERNLLLTVEFKKDIAAARLNLYRYVQTAEYIKVYYQADGLDVWVDGYVETAEVDPWTQDEKLVASIICPQPHWSDVVETYTDASIVTALFEFPFAIDAAGVPMSEVKRNSSVIIQNSGTVETGVIFELTATLAVKNPRIHNLTTGQFIGFGCELQAGDKLVVNTNYGSKSVTHVRDGVETNYIDTLEDGSAWLQMAIGANEYAYTVTDGAMNLGVYHTNRYAGV